MKALVTGGAGFIGSAVVDKLLEEGHTVEVVDNLSTGSLANLERARRGGPFSFHRLDLLDPALAELVATIAPQVVFHLAAQASVAVSVEHPDLDAAVNVLGTVRLLEAARMAHCDKVVFAASGGTLYGSPTRDELPVTEDHPWGPSSPYGIAKAAVLDYLAFYRSVHGLDYTALALANVYGPRQDPYGEAGVAAIFAANIVDGRSSELHGDGEQTRDFVYVNDVADAFVRAGDRGSGMVLNIGTGVQTSIASLYQALAAVNHGAPPTSMARGRDGDVRYSALSPALAREELGWAPATSLEDGLVDVLRFVRQRGDRAEDPPQATACAEAAEQVATLTRLNSR